jgi:hypothetical protein
MTPSPRLPHPLYHPTAIVIVAAHPAAAGGADRPESRDTGTKVIDNARKAAKRAADRQRFTIDGNA